MNNQSKNLINEQEEQEKIQKSPNELAFSQLMMKSTTTKKCNIDKNLEAQKQFDTNENSKKLDQKNIFKYEHSMLENKQEYKNRQNLQAENEMNMKDQKKLIENSKISENQRNFTKRILTRKHDTSYILKKSKTVDNRFQVPSSKNLCHEKVNSINNSQSVQQNVDFQSEQTQNNIKNLIQSSLFENKYINTKVSENKLTSHSINVIMNNQKDNDSISCIDNINKVSYKDFHVIQRYINFNNKILQEKCNFLSLNEQQKSSKFDNNNIKQETNQNTKQITAFQNNENNNQNMNQNNNKNINQDMNQYMTFSTLQSKNQHKSSKFNKYKDQFSQNKNSLSQNSSPKFQRKKQIELFCNLNEAIFNQQDSQKSQRSTRINDNINNNNNNKNDYLCLQQNDNLKNQSQTNIQTNQSIFNQIQQQPQSSQCLNLQNPQGESQISIFYQPEIKQFKEIKNVKKYVTTSKNSSVQNQSEILQKYQLPLQKQLNNKLQFLFHNQQNLKVNQSLNLGQNTQSLLQTLQFNSKDKQSKLNLLTSKIENKNSNNDIERSDCQITFSSLDNMNDIENNEQHNKLKSFNSNNISKQQKELIFQQNFNNKEIKKKIYLKQNEDSYENQENYDIDSNLIKSIYDQYNTTQDRDFILLSSLKNQRNLDKSFEKEGEYYFQNNCINQQQQNNLQSQLNHKQLTGLILDEQDLSKYKYNCIQLVKNSSICKNIKTIFSSINTKSPKYINYNSASLLSNYSLEKFQQNLQQNNSLHFTNDKIEQNKKIIINNRSDFTVQNLDKQQNYFQQNHQKYKENKQSSLNKSDLKQTDFNQSLKISGIYNGNQQLKENNEVQNSILLNENYFQSIDKQSQKQQINPIYQKLNKQILKNKTHQNLNQSILFFNKQNFELSLFKEILK